jgi:hypothetical protein
MLAGGVDSRISKPAWGRILIASGLNMAVVAFLLERHGAVLVVRWT